MRKRKPSEPYGRPLCAVCKGRGVYNFKRFMLPEVVETITHIRLTHDDPHLTKLFESETHFCPYCRADSTIPNNNIKTVRISHDTLSRIGALNYANIVVKGGIYPELLTQLTSNSGLEMLMEGQKAMSIAYDNLLMNCGHNISKEQPQPEKIYDIDISSFQHHDENTIHIGSEILILCEKIKKWYAGAGWAYADQMKHVVTLTSNCQTALCTRLFQTLLDRMSHGLFIETYRGELKVPDILREHLTVNTDKLAALSSYDDATLSELSVAEIQDLLIINIIVHPDLPLTIN